MLKVNAGLTRKIGLPAYGSAGASCTIEMELDQMIVLQDATALQARLTAIYDICRQAVERELGNYQSQTILSENQAAIENIEVAESSTQPELQDRSSTAGNGSELLRAPSSDSPLATDRQINFAHHLARQIRSLGGQRLKELAQQIYSRPLEELTSREASQLIDLLKDMRAGNLDVGELLPGAAA